MTNEQYEEIFLKAMESHRSYARKVRGQQITNQDGLEWWVAKAAYDIGFTDGMVKVINEKD